MTHRWLSADPHPRRTIGRSIWTMLARRNAREVEQVAVELAAARGASEA